VARKGNFKGLFQFREWTDMSPDVTPGYIARANIRVPEITYRWDDWNLEESVGDIDQESYEQLKRLSLRGAFAILVGSAEWVMYRFEELTDYDVQPFEAVDAGWAQVVDPLYAAPWNPFLEWKGPVLGPINRVVVYMIDGADYLGKRVEVARSAAEVLNIAAHVIPDRAAYDAWEKFAIERVAALYPASQSDPLGDPIPREALDPDFDFDVSMTESLINQYLGQLDYDQNGFLATPEEMRSWGFQGTPYAFNFEEDRRRRGI
jgi:hypothetical protein